MTDQPTPQDAPRDTPMHSRTWEACTVPACVTARTEMRAGRFRGHWTSWWAHIRDQGRPWVADDPAPELSLLDLEDRRSSGAPSAQWITHDPGVCGACDAGRSALIRDALDRAAPHPTPTDTPSQDTPEARLTAAAGRLCMARSDDGGRCILNAHPEGTSHGFAGGRDAGREARLTAQVVELEAEVAWYHDLLRHRRAQAAGIQAGREEQRGRAERAEVTLSRVGGVLTREARLAGRVDPRAMVVTVAQVQSAIRGDSG